MEDLGLRVHKSTGRVGQKSSHVGHGSLLTVDHPESVGHINVGQHRKFGRERRAFYGILARLTSIEPNVFQQNHAAGAHRTDDPWRIAEVRYQLDRHSKKLRKPRRHGSKTRLRNGSALGPTQVGYQDDPRSRTTKIVNGRQCRSDPPVIGNHART